MAHIDTSGFEDFFREMQILGEDIDEIADEMLEAGAEVAVEAWKNVIKEHDYIDTGDMLASVAPNKPTNLRSKKYKGPRSIEVYPQGEDRNGMSNAEKAYILHWGTSNPKRRGSRFVDEVDDKAGRKIYEAMEQVMDEHLKKL